jgi:hypothetical protein
MVADVTALASESRLAILRKQPGPPMFLAMMCVGRLRRRDPRRSDRVTRGRLALLAAGILASGCAHAPQPTGPHYPRELVLAFDDNRASAVLALPSLTYESIVRFELPAGKHRPLRLRMQAEAAGTVVIALYENSVLESPGETIRELTREIVPDDLSSGRDGRWVVQDLEGVAPLTGTVWIGVRKLAGAPALWTSTIVSGQTYLRDRDPRHALGLLPVKRTPMIRLELLP